jgi:hypothetical protein
VSRRVRVGRGAKTIAASAASTRRFLFRERRERRENSFLLFSIQFFSLPFNSSLFTRRTDYLPLSTCYTRSISAKAMNAGDTTDSYHCSSC